jgi:hypothetical protein
VELVSGGALESDMNVKQSILVPLKGWRMVSVIVAFVAPEFFFFLHLILQ